MKIKKVIAIGLAVTIAVLSVGCTAQKNPPKATAKATQEVTQTPSKVIEDKKDPETNIDSKKPQAEAYKNVLSMLNRVRNYTLPYWGGYSLKDKQVVIFSADSENAVLWNQNGTGKTVAIKKSDIPEEYTMSSYSKGKMNEHNTIFVMHEGDDKMTFVFAVHEGYHFYGQGWIEKMNLEAEGLPRGTMYPENVDARYYVNEINARLRDKIEGKNKDGHSEALYFFNKYKKEQKADLLGHLNYNLLEQTATFVEYMFLAAAKSPELQNNTKALAKAAYDLNKQDYKEKFIDKTQELYNALPLYYAAIEGKDASINKLTKGKNPYEVLNDITKEKEAKADEALKKQVTDHYNQIEKSVAKKIEAYKKIMKSTDYVLVKISEKLFAGSITYGEFINFKDGTSYKTLNQETTVTTTAGKGKIELNGQDTMNSDDYNYYTMYVPKSSINESNSVLNINTDTLKVENVEFTKDGNAYVIK